MIRTKVMTNFRHSILTLCTALALSVTSSLWADQVEMQNGDRYQGNVLSVSSNIVVLHSDVLDTVNLPRAKIACLTLGSNGPTNRVGLPAAAPSQFRPVRPGSPSPGIPTAKSQVDTNANVLTQVQKQFLDDASPEAKDKFNQMAAGFLSGKISINDIRKEAKSAADQLRALKGNAPDETGMIDGYLAILDSFLKEGGSAVGSATNSSSGALQAKDKVTPGDE